MNTLTEIKTNLHNNWRELTDKSQKELSRMVGVSVQNINAFFKDENTPTGKSKSMTFDKVVRLERFIQDY